VPAEVPLVPDDEVVVVDVADVVADVEVGEPVVLELVFALVLVLVLVLFVPPLVEPRDVAELEDVDVEVEWLELEELDEIDETVAGVQAHPKLEMAVNATSELIRIAESERKRSTIADKSGPMLTRWLVRAGQRVESAPGFSGELFPKHVGVGGGQLAGASLADVGRGRSRRCVSFCGPGHASGQLGQ
jgi:hypothetical protein